MNLSTSEENYIKAIFHLQTGGQTVTTNALARELLARPASITDMLKRLKTKKLIHYQPYQGFRLNTEGRRVALAIIRRHRLWEYFLAEKLKFAWEEVHAIAEELEHVSSRKLVDKLDEYLGFPKFDPHGDPIPDMNGHMESTHRVCLADLPLHTTALVCQVSNQSPEMLELLRHKQIAIGTRLEARRKFPFDNSLEVKIRQHPAVHISEQLAKNIFVTHDA
ncbi:MAG TPA: metal-dependent transcriptional regulator [Chitinophagaceae bacterium]|nr:metal-dependent transcriptional regulator [Chitinophagaceae bacterium]